MHEACRRGVVLGAEHAELCILPPFFANSLVQLHYTDRHRLSPEIEKELNVTWHPNAESLVKVRADNNKGTVNPPSILHISTIPLHTTTLPSHTTTLPLQACDVVTINCPLHKETEHMFDAALIAKMKRGACIAR